MSAEIIPMPPSRDNPAPPAAVPPPLPPADGGSDHLSQLLKNPLVLAGGALLAGMALTRLFTVSPVRKLARDLAGEALKRARSAHADPDSPGGSLLEQGLEAVRPQITDAARRLLTHILKK